MLVLTGGAGFIGSCFLAKLNEMDEKEILVVDHNDSEIKMANLKGKFFLDFVEKKNFIADIEKGKLPREVKAIFHIGACSSTMETDAQYLRQNNLEYSKTLAKWALDEKIPFFYASSAATYGAGEQGYLDADSQIPKLKPLNLYGQSKQDFDLWLLEKKLTSKVVGFKYFNVYGPNEYHKDEMRSLVVKAYQQIKKDQKIRLFKSYKPEFNDGEQKRDFVYIKDVIDLMWEFYQNQQVKGIYNVGSGRARTWNALAQAIFTALSLPVNIEYIDMPEEIKDKYQYFTEADLAKLKKTGLKYSPRILEDAVADYVQGYLEKGFAIL